MISFPNAKINLGLRITRKREDSYHDLDTVFYPLLLCDALEAIPAITTQLFNSGITVESQQENNLVWKSYHILKKDFPSLPELHIFLHKVIPFGAGLGGGSADASFALELFNKIGRLNLSPEQLMWYALKLGSDCPFFILNTACHATSRGEILEPIRLDLKKYFFVIIKPDLHISTAMAFRNIHPQHPLFSTKEIVAKPIHQWKEELMNDFEVPVFEEFPELIFIKEALYHCGALYASMSGSGSAFFGIFKQRPELSESLKQHQVFLIEPS